MSPEGLIARSEAALTPTYALGATPADRRRKAAIIVQCLLNAGDRPPLAALPESAQVDLAREMGRLDAVDRLTLDAVAAEFADHLDALALPSPRGTEGALAALSAHISPAAAARLRAEAAGDLTDPWRAIAALDPAALVAAISAESLEVAAVILSKLPVAKAAEVLGLLPGERARRITYAVSRTSGVSPAAVRRIGEAVAAQRCAGRLPAFAITPVERVGAILNSSRQATRDEMLDGLDAEDRAFGAQVRRAIFTFAHLPARVRPADLPKTLRAVDARVSAMALAYSRALGGNFAAAADFVLANIPTRLGDSLREEMETLGPVRERDGEAAQAAVVAAIRDAVAAGEIALVVPADEE